LRETVKRGDRQAGDGCVTAGGRCGPGAGNVLRCHKMRVMMKVVLSCRDNWLTYNRQNHVAGERWQQARKKPQVTSLFPERSCLGGGCAGYNDGQFPQIGPMTLGLYAIAGIPGADYIRARQWLSCLPPLQTRLGHGLSAIRDYILFAADRVRVASCRSGGTAAVALLLTVGRRSRSGRRRLNRVGKSAGGPQGNLWSTGWRPNPPESKKSARQR
jgi:hypothetical protein